MLLSVSLMVLGHLLGVTNAAWQDDLPPKKYVTQLPEKRIQRFLGNQTHSDHFKLLEQDGDSLLVGARNIVYNISLITLQENKRLEWYSDENDIKMCKLKGKSEEACHNYIRVLARKSEDVILVCGTNAYKPMCRNYKQTESEYQKTDEITGEGLCPYDPNHNSTAIFADDKLYVATVAQFSGADSLIYRKPLRTEQFNPKFLNVPSFVSSIHHQEFVYFFFRETAVEYINCGKTVYSRVARVCTSDKGGPHKFKNHWTTFLKARLNCSVPGEFPFYFNEIQSTSQIIKGTYGSQSAELIYAVFTTSPNSITASAVCAFRVEDILRTFEGPFKGQEAINSNWLPVQGSKVPEPRPGQCVTDSRTLPEMTLNFIKEHTLMDQAVPAFWGEPVALHTGFKYRYTYIAVDPQVETLKGKKYDVLFIGTDNGKVIKALNAGSADGHQEVLPTIIEEITVFPEHWPITNLLVYRSPRGEGKLVVVSQNEIKAIPLHDCESRAMTCSDCVGLQDPYCVWDGMKCTGSRAKYQKNFVQNIEKGMDPACPGAAPREEHGTVSPPTCAPCKCDCPAATDGSNNTTSGEGFSAGSVAHRSPHHSASRHDGHQDEDFSSSHMNGEIDNGAVTGASRGHPTMYTAETLAFAVITSIVSSLVLGFILGYIFSRRCRKEEVGSPYDETPYLEQQHSGRLGRDPPSLNHSESFLSPGSNNKPINLVLNVHPKNGNGKNANSSADNKPVQKVKKIYL